MPRGAGVAVAELAGVGVGLPGRRRPADGTVEHAVNLGIERAARRSRPLVAERLGVPVPRGERPQRRRRSAPRTVASHASTGDAVHDLAFLALGTGLAAGLLLDGRLRRGRDAARPARSGT